MRQRLLALVGLLLTHVDGWWCVYVACYRYQLAAPIQYIWAFWSAFCRVSAPDRICINCSSKFVTMRLSFQHYDCLIGIGGGIGFTPFMSILKDFLAAKRHLRSNGDAKSSGYLALFYGVCRNLNDVAWWSSLSTEPDFSDFVSSCSVAIGADPRFASHRDSKAPRPSNQVPQSRKSPHTSIRLSNVGKRVSVNLATASLGSDMSKGLLGITLFCTGASEEQILAAKAVAAPGVSVRPGRPLFEKIFKCVLVDAEVNHRTFMIYCAGTSTERF